VPLKFQNFVHFFPLHNLLVVKRSIYMSIWGGFNPDDLLLNESWHINKIELGSIIDVKSMITNTWGEENVLITFKQAEWYAWGVVAEGPIRLKQNRFCLILLLVFPNHHLSAISLVYFCMLCNLLFEFFHLTCFCRGLQSLPLSEKFVVLLLIGHDS